MVFALFDCLRGSVNKWVFRKSTNFGSFCHTLTGANVKNISKFVGAVVAGLVATTNSVLAAPCLVGQPCHVPEPGTLALVGVAVAVMIVIARKRKK